MKDTYKGIPIKRIPVKKYNGKGCIFEEGTDCIKPKGYNYPCTNINSHNYVWVIDEEEAHELSINTTNL